MRCKRTGTNYEKLAGFIREHQDTSDCWIWTGARVIPFDGVSTTAGKIAWATLKGEKPAQHLRWHCGTPNCINPDHAVLRRDLMRALAVRFWEKVDKSGECWEWTAARSYGYGALRVEGKTVRASRLAWELTHGSFDDALFVLHKCDNPSCVNPDHLFLGTAADNSADMAAKGRGAKHKRPHGEAHKNAKLTEAAVRDMRERYAAGTSMYRLAKEYGVDKTLVSRIIKRLIWTHVT